MNYSEFKNWKSTHSTEMQDLTFAKPYDIFIFTRFTGHNPSDFEGRQVVYAENIDEAIGYIRHVFLYDILNDTADDLEFELKSPFDERQEDLVTLFNFWYKAGKIGKGITLKDFLRDFNCCFNSREATEYELRIIKGANELRNFLVKRYSENESFDKKRLCDVCSNDLFSGKLLKDFLDKFFG